MDDSDDPTKSGERNTSPSLMQSRKSRFEPSTTTPMVVSSDEEKEAPFVQIHKKKQPVVSRAQISEEEDSTGAQSRDVIMTSVRSSSKEEPEEVGNLDNSQRSDVSTVMDESSLDDRLEPEKAPSLPRAGCPEKIVLCLDFGLAEETTPFQISSKDVSVSNMTRRVVEVFLACKHSLNPKHEFAIVILKESAIWCQDFTSNVQEVMQAVNAYTDLGPCPKLDLSSLFNTLEQHASLPMIQTSELSDTAPPYIVRAVLLYSRSFSIPEFRSGKDSFSHLINMPYFFLDTLYIHEPISVENNMCEQVLSVLSNLCEKDNSYLFCVTRTSVKFHNIMAKLLPHPLQRPLQDDAHYKLENPAER